MSNEQLSTLGAVIKVAYDAEPASPFTCTTFTSTGIDDNATGERLQIADTVTSVGSAVSASTYAIARPITDGGIVLSGGNDGANDARIILYGADHSSSGGDLLFISKSNTTQLQYDDSASSWNFQANDITTTGNITSAGFIYAANTILTDDNTFFLGAATATQPVLQFDSGGDYLTFERSTNSYTFFAGYSGAPVTMGILNTTDISATGIIDFSGLPTSDPAVAGRLWRSTNTVMISTG